MRSGKLEKYETSTTCNETEDRFQKIIIGNCESSSSLVVTKK